MKINIQTIVIIVLTLTAGTSSAESLIPERCFVNGELDCERPECRDICFTPPTPGFERLPPSMQRSHSRSSEEEDAYRIHARPQLKVPFKEDEFEPNKIEINPSSTHDIKNTNSKNINLKTSCSPLNSEEMLDILQKKAFHKEWIKIAKQYIHSDLGDPISNYEMLQEHEYLYDLYVFMQQEKSCYPSNDKCIQSGGSDIQKKLDKLFQTLFTLRTKRERYYKAHTACLNRDKKHDAYTRFTFGTVEFECLSEFELSYQKDIIIEYEQKFAEQVEELTAMQCHSDD